MGLALELARAARDAAPDIAAAPAEVRSSAIRAAAARTSSFTFFASAFPSIMTADTNQSSFFSGPPGPSPASALWAASRFT